MDHKGPPMDLGMFLSKDENAKKQFESLTEWEQQSVNEWANSIRSKQEMDRLVSNLASAVTEDHPPRHS